MQEIQVDFDELMEQRRMTKCIFNPQGVYILRETKNCVYTLDILMHFLLFSR